MTLHNHACFSGHLGIWLHEPGRFNEALSAIRSGVMKPRAIEFPLTLSAAVVDGDSEDVIDPKGEVSTLYRLIDGIAIVEVHGTMMKGWSKYADASTVHLRRVVRAAGADDRVREILMVIDSPGGQAAGTQALADDIEAIGKKKPLFAHIDDLGASAAYWIASGARSISANRTALIGSIGTVAVVWDESKKFDMEGIAVKVVSTGSFKGAFAEGAAITPEQLAQLQVEVDALNAHFLAAVSNGRTGKMDAKAVKAAADGRVWIASEAKALGLIDEVRSLDDTVFDILKARTGGVAGASRSRRMRLASTTSGSYSASQIAEKLGAPLHRIKYVIRSRGIEPVYKSEYMKLYSGSAVNQIRREIQMISAIR